MTNKKLLLIILDGWGKGDGSKSDIITNADLPYTKNLHKTSAYNEIKTSGEDVGLPKGQMGNSEVGHINLGAGRVVYQDLVKISKDIEGRTFHKNKVILEAIDYARKNNKSIHLMGLVSHGGVHSAMDHLFGLIDVANENDFHDLYIHAYTDGRDTDPHSGINYVSELEDHLKKSTGKIATVCGRYYAMDRDKRWDRIKLAYDMLLEGKGEKFDSSAKAIKSSYDNDITDEFIKPSVITDEKGSPVATIKENDVVICFNFRTDRLREITTVLTQQDMPEHDMKTMPLHYLTLTRYDESFKNINIIYEKPDLQNTLGEVLASQNKKQLRISETEKYPHVTFFFSGGREDAFEGEERVMIPSPKVPTYDHQPEMSASEVKDAVIKEINKNKFDFICLNFANADMVGHTGICDAIRKALETVDACLEKVVKAALDNYYSVIITADHGNADYTVNPDGSPNTAHTINPVPCWLIDNDYNKIDSGKLADLAPTILKILNLDIPEDMEGKALV